MNFENSIHKPSCILGLVTGLGFGAFFGYMIRDSKKPAPVEVILTTVNNPVETKTITTEVTHYVTIQPASASQPSTGPAGP